MNISEKLKLGTRKRKLNEQRKKIIILGAGQVGGTVAEILAAENHEVTVVDRNPDILRELNDRMDIRTILGQASYPKVLRDAGADEADFTIAATDSDETNMVAMQIVYSILKGTGRVARIRSQEYIQEKDFFINKNMPIQVVISPEILVTDRIQHIIEHPGAMQVVDFANGRVRLVGVRIDEGAAMDGKPMSALPDLLQDTERARVVAIYRLDEPLIPQGSTVLQADDIVFFISGRRHTAELLNLFHYEDKKCQYVMIAGGGNIGYSLAKQLEDTYRVKIIERNPDRAEFLASNLDDAMVLQGDAADHDMLEEENVQDVDVFCALTNDDEANILSSMLAKSMGAHKTMSLINRKEYVNLVERDIIDIAISPQLITIGALLTHIRGADVVAVHSLRKGRAEALEVIAHGENVVGKEIDALELPKGATIGCVVRGQQTLMPHHDLVIEAEDHVIILVVQKDQIEKVGNLFQVGATEF